MNENPLFEKEQPEPTYRKQRLSASGQKAKDDFTRYALDYEGFFDSAVNGVEFGEPIMFEIEEIEKFAAILGYLVDEKKICVDFSENKKEFSLQQLKFECKKKVG